MRNLILIAAILVFTLSYAQDRNIKSLQLFHLSNTASLNLESGINNEVFLEISDVLKDLVPVNNTEGKFTKYKNTQIQQLDIETELSTSVLKEQILSKQIAELYVLNYVVAKVLKDKKYRVLNGTPFKDAIVLDGRKISSTVLNKLLYNYNINTRLNVQIGKDIIHFINKLHKTELDHTLNSSLNLLAINF